MAKDRKVLLGTITLERDVVMYNNQFQYAASFEQLNVPKGEYPIYTYESNLKKDKDGKVRLGYLNFLGFEGTVLSGNIGNKPGDHSRYDLCVYEYTLADYFLDGYDYYNKIIRAEYVLRPEWGIELHDFVSSFDGKRCFVKALYLKDGEEPTYE